MFADLTDRPRGLILVTGPTGSGKSTTLAAMVNHVNENEYGHILTIEDPIEFLHESKKCLINQRELGPHTLSFPNALRAALREDPDYILVGEMRDLETIRLALTAAETGHLVFATLHTSSAAKTIDRIIDVFPAAEKDMVRAMLSESLVAVISQTLLKTKDGQGRVAAHEIMIGTPAIRNLIRENKVAQMYSSIQTGQAIGMQTLDQNLIELVRRNVISAAEARHARRQQGSVRRRLIAQRARCHERPDRRRIMEREQATKFIHELLQLMVKERGSDLFITAGVPAGDQGRRQDHAGVEDCAVAAAHDRARAQRDERQAGGRVRSDEGMQLRDQPARRRPLPRQRVHSAEPRRHGAAHDHDRHPEVRRPRPAARAQGHHHDQARHHDVRRRDRRRQVDVDGVAARLPQREQLRPHHHDRGSDRVRARPQELHRHAARGRRRHATAGRSRCAIRCARRPT